MRWLGVVFFLQLFFFVRVEINVWSGMVIVELSGFSALEFSFRVLFSAIIEANHRRTAAAIVRVNTESNNTGGG